MRSAHYWPSKNGAMLKALPQDDGATLFYQSIKTGDGDEYWSPFKPQCKQVSKKCVGGSELWTPAQARTKYAMSQWGNEALYAWEFARRQFRLVWINGVLTAEERIHETWYPVYIPPECDPIFEGLLKAAKAVAALLAARDEAAP